MKNIKITMKVIILKDMHKDAEGYDIMMLF